MHLNFKVTHGYMHGIGGQRIQYGIISLVVMLRRVWYGFGKVHWGHFRFGCWILLLKTNWNVQDPGFYTSITCMHACKNKKIL